MCGVIGAYIKDGARGLEMAQQLGALVVFLRIWV